MQSSDLGPGSPEPSVVPDESVVLAGRKRLRSPLLEGLAIAKRTGVPERDQRSA